MGVGDLDQERAGWWEWGPEVAFAPVTVDDAFDQRSAIGETSAAPPFPSGRRNTQSRSVPKASGIDSFGDHRLPTGLARESIAVAILIGGRSV